MEYSLILEFLDPGRIPMALFQWITITFFEALEEGKVTEMLCFSLVQRRSVFILLL
jgi:hypothetical protein